MFTYINKYKQGPCTFHRHSVNIVSPPVLYASCTQRCMEAKGKRLNRPMLISTPAPPCAENVWIGILPHNRECLPLQLQVRNLMVSGTGMPW